VPTTIDENKNKKFDQRLCLETKGVVFQGSSTGFFILALSGSQVTIVQVPAVDSYYRAFTLLFFLIFIHLTITKNSITLIQILLNFWIREEKPEQNNSPH